MTQFWWYCGMKTLFLESSPHLSPLYVGGFATIVIVVAVVNTASER